MTPENEEKLKKQMQNFAIKRLSKSEAAAAPPVEKSTFDSVKGVGGKVLGKVGDAFEVGVKEVTRPVLGAAVKGATKLEEATGIEGLTGFTEEQKAKILSSESYTDAFNKRFEDERAYKKMLVEIAFDPLNLVGVGAAAKIRHAAKLKNVVKAGSTTDKALGTVQTADELASRAMALPITGTKAVLSKGAEWTGVKEPIKKLFAESQKGKYFTGLRKAVGLFQRGGEEEILKGAEGSLIRQQTRDVGNRLFEEVSEEGTNFPIMKLRDDARDTFANLSPHDSVRQWEGNANLLKDNMDIRKDLFDRGIVNGAGGVTNSAKFHEQLDTALRGAGWTNSERDVLHNVIGFMAEEIPSNQTWERTVFKSSDDVYQNLKVQRGTTTGVSRSGSTGIVTIGPEDHPGTLISELFDNFFVHSLPIQEREKIYRALGRTPQTTGDTSVFEGYGEQVVNLFRGANLGDDTTLGRIATEVRDILRFREAGPTSGLEDVRVPEWGDAFATGPQSTSGANVPGGRPGEADPTQGRFADGVPGPGDSPSTSWTMDPPEVQGVGSSQLPPAPPPRGTANVQDLNPDASFDDFVTRLGQARNIPKEQFEPIREAMKPHLIKNEEAFKAGYLIDNENFAEGLVRAAQDPANMNRHMETAMEAVDNEFGAMWFRNPLAARATEVLRIPHLGQRSRQASQSKAFGRAEDVMLKKYRDDATEILSNDKVQKWVTEWQKTAAIVDNGLVRIREEIPIANIMGDETFSDVLSDPRIMKRFTQEEREALSKAWETLGGGRGGYERERRFAKKAQEAWLVGLEKDLGIRHGKTSTMGRQWTRAVSAWKEVTLFTPRYHAQNVLDMSIKSLIYGVPGTSAVRGQRGAIERAHLWGRVRPPEALRGNAERRAAEMAGFQTPESRSQLASYFGGGRYMDDATGEWHEGTKVGRFIGSKVSWSRRLAMEMETSAKSAAWVVGTERHLEKSFKPRFLSYASRQARASGMSEQQTSELIKSMRVGGVDYSPEKVREWVIKSGGSDDVATDISNLWRVGIDEASLAGEDLAIKVHFQFADERVIEDKLKLRHILPFHIWATRNIPFYIETIAQNPQIVRAFQAYDRASDAEREQMGLSQRFEGKLQLPGPFNTLAELMLGPGIHAFNPMIAFSIADQFKGSPYIPDEEKGGPGMLGKAIMQGQRAGFTPAPWIDLPLNVAGIYGAREPFGIWRHGDVVAGSVEAATGVDVDFKPTVEIATHLRNKLSPVTGVQKVDTVSNSQFLDRAINNKIRQYAIEEGTGADDPDYKLAATDPESEIYKRARAEVVKENLRRNAYSMVSPVPHSKASDAEGEAMNALSFMGDVQLSPGAMQYMRSIEHPGTNFWGIPDTKTQAEITAGFGLKDEGLTNEDISQFGLESFFEYLQWRKSQPQFAERGVAQFMQDR